MGLLLRGVATLAIVGIGAAFASGSVVLSQITSVEVPQSVVIDPCNPTLWKLKLMVWEKLIYPTWLPFISEETKLNWGMKKLYTRLVELNITATKCPEKLPEVIDDIEKEINKEIEVVTNISRVANITVEPAVMVAIEKHIEILKYAKTKAVEKNITIVLDKYIYIYKEKLHRLKERIREKIKEWKIRANKTIGIPEKPRVNVTPPRYNITPPEKPWMPQPPRHNKTLPGHPIIICPQVFDPVVCDGRVYQNLCYAIAAGEDPDNCKKIKPEHPQYPTHLPAHKWGRKYRVTG